VTIRSHTETLVFDGPFRLTGLDRLLPAGRYDVLTDEEMIEDLSFPCFRRVSTVIMVPGEWPFASAVEMIATSPTELSLAQGNDKAASSE
jgi:hypothetical protein